MLSRLWSPAEVADRYQVKETTVWRWVRSGRISALDVGCGSRPGPYLFREEDLKAFEKARLRRCNQ